MHLNNKYIFSTIISFIIMSFVFSSCSFADSYIWSNDDELLYTSSTDSDSNNLNLESGAAILIEQNTGKVLYEHNIHAQLRPASVTKVMTILLIMEALDER